MDYIKMFNKWQNDKCFLIENDCLKKKMSFISSIPRADLFGFQDLRIREILISDIVSRYERLNNTNVLYPVGVDSLCNRAFLENKRQQNKISDELSNTIFDQMLYLGIGVNKNKRIDLRHDEYLSNLQLFFIELYEKGYIKYDIMQVYYDEENNKIYDLLTTPQKNLPIISKKVFYLDIEEIIPELILDINRLNVSNEIKKNLYNYLLPNKKMRIDINLSNNKLLPIIIDNPEYLAGISFILINPDFLDESIDLNNLIDINEYSSLISFFEGNLNSFFSGIYAKNPLTMKNIPIFISNIYTNGIHLGIPDVDSEDEAIIKELDIDYIKILENGKLINSDFLNGLSLEDARITIENTFLSENIADIIYDYDLKKILITSNDTFGALFPFLKDEDDKLYSLKNYLPYKFSKQFRPVLKDGVDIPGQNIEGTINNLFSIGCYPIISILYDEIAVNESIFSYNTKDEIKKWLPYEINAVKKENITKEIFMPLILFNILKREFDYDVPNLFNEIFIVEKSCDNNGKEINRKNNNLIDLNFLLQEFSPDSIRLYFMSKQIDKEFIFDRKELEEYDLFIKSLNNSLMNKITEMNTNLDYELDNLLKKANDLLSHRNIILYCKEIYEFSNKYMIYPATKKQILKYLSIVYPIMPYLADNVYTKLFNNRYSIINEGWPE